jgi:hypothetical protein
MYIAQPDYHWTLTMMITHFFASTFHWAMYENAHSCPLIIAIISRSAFWICPSQSSAHYEAETAPDVLDFHAAVGQKKH